MAISPKVTFEEERFFHFQHYARDSEAESFFFKRLPFQGTAELVFGRLVQPLAPTLVQIGNPCFGVYESGCTSLSTAGGRDQFLFLEPETAFHGP